MIAIKENVNKAVKCRHASYRGSKSYMNNEIIDLYQEDPQNFKIIGVFRKPSNML